MVHLLRLRTAAAHCLPAWRVTSMSEPRVPRAGSSCAGGSVGSDAQAPGVPVWAAALASRSIALFLPWSPRALPACVSVQTPF